MEIWEIKDQHPRAHNSLQRDSPAFDVEKEGSSNTTERVSLIKRILLPIKPENIDSLLGDREFIGTEWIKWLDKQNVSFFFHIRNLSTEHFFAPPCSNSIA